MSASSFKDLAKDRKLDQDHKRDLNQKHKWARGEGPVTAGQLGRRPAKPFGSSHQNWRKREVEFQQNKAIDMAKISRKRDVASVTDLDGLTDSSAEEDVKEASAAPEPDAGYTYSFDAPRGPGHGSQILSMAISQAVERFETKITEKLVKEEYEVVVEEKEETRAGYAADEDDFEFV